jgi:N-acetylglutamate synthase-like GNAT family acetyltransferase
MIRRCADPEFDDILAIINDAAAAYEGVIPDDRWHVPYMSTEELRAEIAAAVEFWGYQQDGALVGVMGVQRVEDVTLIRHAYVRTKEQHRGIGGALLAHLLAHASTPLLVGTWAAAAWAVRFYEQRGFEMVTPTEKNRLLRRYWTVPERQIETSVVLARGWAA